MLNPNDVITTMAQQREQERAADVQYYMLRKACEARAVEMHKLLSLISARAEVNFVLVSDIDQLLQEIDNASR